MIRIVVADDHPLFREGLRKALSTGVDMCLVEEAADGESALTACERARPDILLLDLKMPLRDGFSVLRELNKTSPATRVLVLTGHAERRFEEEALRCGAAGFLPKDSSAQTILDAIRAVAAGQTWASRAAAYRVLDSQARHEAAIGPAPLTDREQELLGMLAQGLKNREMASQLGLSEKTVTSRLARLIQKLDARGRVDLALFAREYTRTRSNSSD